MSRPLLITRDAGGFPTTGASTCRAFPQITQVVDLTASTAKAITVPLLSNGRMAAFFTFTPSAAILISPVATPTITLPNNTVTASIHEFLLNGSGREVVGGQQIQLITDGTGVSVSISYYSIGV